MIYYRIHNRTYCKLEMADRIAFLAILTIIALVILAGCAHEPVAELHGPGGALRFVTKTGVVFTDQGHALWLKEGVPANLFTMTKDGWYMSSLEYHEGDKIRQANANP